MIIVYLGRRGDADIPKTSLDNAERQLTGEEKTQFLRFVRQMLAWKPEERSSARDLLHDPLCSKVARISWFCSVIWKHGPLHIYIDTA